MVIAGRSAIHVGPNAHSVAMVFQNYALHPHMTAFGAIALPLAMRKPSLFENLPLLRLASPRRPRKTLRAASIVAADATGVYPLHRDAFDRVAEESPKAVEALYRSMIRVLAGRLTSASSEIAIMDL